MQHGSFALCCPPELGARRSEGELQRCLRYSRVPVQHSILGVFWEETSKDTRDTTVKQLYFGTALDVAKSTAAASGTAYPPLLCYQAEVTHAHVLGRDVPSFSLVRRDSAFYAPSTDLSSSPATASNPCFHVTGARDAPPSSPMSMA